MKTDTATEPITDAHMSAPTTPTSTAIDGGSGGHHAVHLDDPTGLTGGATIIDDGLTGGAVPTTSSSAQITVDPEGEEAPIAAQHTPSADRRSSTPIVGDSSCGCTTLGSPGLPAFGGLGPARHALI